MCSGLPVKLACCCSTSPLHTGEAFYHVAEILHNHQPVMKTYRKIIGIATSCLLTELIYYDLYTYKRQHASCALCGVFASTSVKSLAPLLLNLSPLPRNLLPLPELLISAHFPLPLIPSNGSDVRLQYKNY